MLIGVQFNVKSLAPEFLTRADVFQACDIIFEDDVTFERKSQCFGKGFLPQVASGFVEIRGGGFDPAFGIGEAIVIEDESAFVVVDVGVGEDVSVGG